MNEIAWTSEWLTGSIFDDEPGSWQGLQNVVAQLFSELGYLNVHTPHKLKGVRTTKEVDVYAEDHSAGPPVTIACECKRWDSAVPQGVVLEFRTVLDDTGINRGFIISKAGFQSGAHDAACNTPIVLADFNQLQELFFTTWVKAMSIRLDRSARRLIGFHPLGWYDFQQTLAQDKMSALFDLHKKYETVFSSLMGMTLLEANSLPVSCGITARNTSIFEPYRKQGIKTYRQFFDRHLGIVDQALDEFQVLFGSIG